MHTTVSKEFLIQWTTSLFFESAWYQFSLDYSWKEQPSFFTEEGLMCEIFVEFLCWILFEGLDRFARLHKRLNRSERETKKGVSYTEL